MFDFKLLSFVFTIFVNFMDPFHIIRRFVVRPATKSFTTIYEDYKEKAFDKLDGSQSVILRFFVIFSIAFLLFCGAVLLYVLFYILYMPSSTHVKPVHMQYEKICDDKNCDLSSMTSPYHSFPIAHLQLTRSQLMMIGQPYHVTVQLELPETPRNKDLGVFMVCLDMKDKENLLKSHSCRSTMLRFSSPWLTKVKTILLMPFFVFGVREEKQDLFVEMFHSFKDTTNPVTDIYVEIQSKVIEFYSVSIHITAHFTGLRYLIFNFPTISAVVGIFVNFFVLSVITLMLWNHYDYEMEWVDEARRKYTGKPKSPKSSSSSLLELNDSDKFEDDGFLFDSEDDVGIKKRKKIDLEE